MTFVLPKEQTVKSILKFLQVYLPQFRESFLSERIVLHREDDISRKLLLFLQDKIKNLLIHFDAKEGVDFLIYIKPYVLTAEPIFLIEAKRLPSTNNKDYVQGSTGGIERYKREQYGYGKHLVKSAMIGYIQKFTKEYWFEKVNNWIGEMIENESELDWNKEDKLIKDKELSDFTSIHKRITKSPITLYHFWLILYA